MSALTKIALVTGGSRGLGKDMATSIALKGIDVIITYRSNEVDALQTVQLAKRQLLFSWICRIVLQLIALYSRYWRTVFCLDGVGICWISDFLMYDIV